MTATHVGGSSNNVNATVLDTPYPAGIQAGDTGYLFWWGNDGNDATSEPPGWTLLDVHIGPGANWGCRVYKRTMAGNESGSSISVSKSGITKHVVAIDVWRGAFEHGGLVWQDFASTVVADAAVPAVSTPGRTAQWLTSWGSRTSTPPTSVTVPAGTTLSSSQFQTGGGAWTCAVAYEDTAETDGSVGSGSWVRNNTASTNICTCTIALLEPQAAAAPVFKEWNGTSWVTLTPKEWNGTAWVAVTPKEL